MRLHVIVLGWVEYRTLRYVVSAGTGRLHLWDICENYFLPIVYNSLSATIFCVTRKTVHIATTVSIFWLTQLMWLAKSAAARQAYCHSTSSDIVSRWVWFQDYRLWHCDWQSAVHGLKSQHCFLFTLLPTISVDCAPAVCNKGCVEIPLKAFVHCQLDYCNAISTGSWCSDETATVSAKYSSLSKCQELDAAYALRSLLKAFVHCRLDYCNGILTGSWCSDEMAIGYSQCKKTVACLMSGAWCRKCHASPPQPPFATSAVQWVIFKDDISIYDTLPI